MSLSCSVSYKCPVKVRVTTFPEFLWEQWRHSQFPANWRGNLSCQDPFLRPEGTAEGGEKEGWKGQAEAQFYGLPPGRCNCLFLGGALVRAGVRPKFRRESAVLHWWGEGPRRGQKSTERTTLEARSWGLVQWWDWPLTVNISFGIYWAAGLCQRLVLPTEVKRKQDVPSKELTALEGDG